MAYQPYLLFQLNGRQYGIEAPVVQELFLLPALTPIAETADEMVGILNLRGHLIPVIDLKQRLGQGRQPYTLKHAVMLITLDQRSVGVIVDEVHDVELIDESELGANLSSHLMTAAEHLVTAGLAHHDSQLVTLLQPQALITGAIAPCQRPTQADNRNEFLAQFSTAEQAVLAARAAALKLQSEGESLVGLTALAIVGVQGERFALGLETIQEFTEVSQITPIPCCPPHIVGNMNLRGEILTLIDIRQFLNLDPTTASSQRQAVIVRVEAIVAGLMVDEVFDVMYVHPTDMAAMPTVIHSASNDYIRGVIRDSPRFISLLDLPKLFTHGELVVEQVA